MTIAAAPGPSPAARSAPPTLLVTSDRIESQVAPKWGFRGICRSAAEKALSGAVASTDIMYIIGDKDQCWGSSNPLGHVGGDRQWRGPWKLVGTEVTLPTVNRNLDILAGTADGRASAI